MVKNPGLSLTMPASIQLEYACTEAERNEAQSLQFRKALAGGSRWRAQLILWGTLAVGLTVLYFQIRLMVSPKYQPLIYVGLLLLFVGLIVRRRYFTLKAADPVRLVLSEQGVMINSDHSQVTLPWSAFSQCLESPNLFVLVDRPKVILFTLPKRAFPDEIAQDWFRTLTAQIPPATTPINPESLPMPQAVADGVALRFQLHFKDHLVRNVTSWRMRVAFALVFAFIGGTLLWESRQPHPNAVNGPWTVLAIAIPIFGVMMVVAMLFVSFYSWWLERKHHSPQQLVLSEQGIDFNTVDGRGILAWNTYECYLENRWCFIIWKRQGSLWYLFPKRAFASEAETARCRELLQKHLRRSRWFFL